MDLYRFSASLIAETSAHIRTCATRYAPLGPPNIPTDENRRGKTPTSPATRMTKAMRITTFAEPPRPYCTWLSIPAASVLKGRTGHSDHFSLSLQSCHSGRIRMFAFILALGSQV